MQINTVNNLKLNLPEIDSENLLKFKKENFMIELKNYEFWPALTYVK